MRYYLKIVLSILQKPIDFFLCIISVPAALILLIYRMGGYGRFPKTTFILKKIGLFPIRNHYYEPLFVDRLLLNPLSDDRNLPGINFNDSRQIYLLKELVFRQELLSLELNKPSKELNKFSIKNGSFESGDADFLYQFIRHTKPTKLIEIGSGNSTKIARIALLKNSQESGVISQHICIEPYEQPWLEKLDNLIVVRDPIESCNINFHDELDSGDLLFVDSSHIIRPQGDVLKEYLEIFPSLKSGVYIHIHDIFTPKDYLKSWVVDDVRFWNEQYLLEAMLSNTNRYEIIAALNYLKHKHYELLYDVCPYLTRDREPGSFYLRVI